MKKISFKEYVFCGLNNFDPSDKELTDIIEELSEYIDSPKGINKLNKFFDKCANYENEDPS